MRRLTPFLLVLLSLVAVAPAHADDAPQGAAQTLSRFYNAGTGTYYDTVYPAPPGFVFEKRLGALLASSGPGRIGIYSCLTAAGGDRFLSGDAGCEGQGQGLFEGYVYGAAPAQPVTVPLARCVQPNGRRFASDDAGCEGRTLEAVLGYMPRVSDELLRYANSSTLRRWASTGGAPPGYAYELPLGRVLDAPGPGRTAAYLCSTDEDGWIGTDAACPGADLVGYVLAGPSTDQQTLPLYRCIQVGVTRFMSNDPGCEGAQQEALVGYTLRFGSALRQYFNPSTGTSWTTTGGVGVGFRYAETLGFLLPTGGVGLRAVYGCATGANHALSLDPGCGGATPEGRYGFAYTSQQDNTRELFACRDAAGTSFASTDSRCEGQTTVASIGWAPQSDGSVAVPACSASGASVTNRLRRRVVRYGARPTVTGVAATPAGPAVGATVYVIDVAGQVLGAAPAGAGGAFSVRLQPGASRTVRAGFRAAAEDEALACGAPLTSRVRAGVVLRAPRSVRRGRVLRLRGRVLGGTVAAQRTVTLQAFDRGRWRTFRNARTRADGRFAVRYRFSRGAQRKRYPFRAVTRAEQGFPYAPGRSRTRRVRLR